MSRAILKQPLGSASAPRITNPATTALNVQPVTLRATLLARRNQKAGAWFALTNMAL